MVLPRRRRPRRRRRRPHGAGRPGHLAPRRRRRPHLLARRRRPRRRPLDHADRRVLARRVRYRPSAPPHGAGRADARAAGGRPAQGSPSRAISSAWAAASPGVSRTTGQSAARATSTQQLGRDLAAGERGVPVAAGAGRVAAVVQVHQVDPAGDRADVVDGGRQVPAGGPGVAGVEDEPGAELADRLPQPGDRRPGRGPSRCRRRRCSRSAAAAGSRRPSAWRAKVLRQLSTPTAGSSLASTWPPCTTSPSAPIAAAACACSAEQLAAGDADAVVRRRHVEHVRARGRRPVTSPARSASASGRGLRRLAALRIGQEDLHAVGVHLRGRASGPPSTSSPSRVSRADVYADRVRWPRRRDPSSAGDRGLAVTPVTHLRSCSVTGVTRRVGERMQVDAEVVRRWQPVGSDAVRGGARRRGARLGWRSSVGSLRAGAAAPAPTPRRPSTIRDLTPPLVSVDQAARSPSSTRSRTRRPGRRRRPARRGSRVTVHTDVTLGLPSGRRASLAAGAAPVEEKFDQSCLTCTITYTYRVTVGTVSAGSADRPALSSAAAEPG